MASQIIEISQRKAWYEQNIEFAKQHQTWWCCLNQSKQYESLKRNIGTVNKLFHGQDGEQWVIKLRAGKDELEREIQHLYP